MTLDEHRLEVINKGDNYNVIKQCIDTSLDELYDFIEALKVENDTKSAESLEQMVEILEDLRKKYLNHTLTSKELESISILLDMRTRVLIKKADQLVAAVEQITDLRDEYANYTPEITVLKN